MIRPPSVLPIPFFCLMCLLSARSDEQAPVDDTLQGEWHDVVGDADETHFSEVTLRIKGSKYSRVVVTTVSREYQLDDRMNPPEIVINTTGGSLKGLTKKGVLSVDQDHLIICTSLMSNDPIPRTLDPGKGRLFEVWSRDVRNTAPNSGKEEKGLIGTWRLDRSVVGGVELRDALKVPATLKVTPKRLVRTTTSIEEGELRIIDHEKGFLDFIPSNGFSKGLVIPSLYGFRSDKLIIRSGAPGGDRPKDLAVEKVPNSQVITRTFSRRP